MPLRHAGFGVYTSLVLRSDFSFDLPEDLIAQFPSPERGADRLMVLSRGTGAVSHHHMDDLPRLIPSGALMVFNDSRVRKARVYAVNEVTEKTVEFLFTSPVSSTAWKTMVRNARRQRGGATYRFPDGSRATLLSDPALDGTEFRILAFDGTIQSQEDWFERNGHIPLPPYINRADSGLDAERYQTVYARETGSAAAPTAGLHFTHEMLHRLDEAGIERVTVTLHVGLGTFLPVRVDRIEDHPMHYETYTISPDAAARINRAKVAGRPILAVGTTSVRTLEAAAARGAVHAGTGATNIFIYPGYEFCVVDALFTNFHTPESTLLMLVSAFAGRGPIRAAYEKAMEERYRFFSYGDAMLIL
jgi:S-adenosylmethionine:tRNA ribosyltransferase-isomerase